MKTTENTTPALPPADAEPPEPAAGGSDLRLVRPLNIRPVKIGTKWLYANEIEKVVTHYLEETRRHLKEMSKSNMIELAALGHQFTPEEWKACLDDSLPNANMDARRDKTPNQQDG